LDVPPPQRSALLAAVCADACRSAHLSFLALHADRALGKARTFWPPTGRQPTTTMIRPRPRRLVWVWVRVRAKRRCLWSKTRFIAG
jgi:hypothetical protein